VWMFFVEHPNPARPWSTIGNNFCDPDPCGVGCARLATLAIAPPSPQGLGWSFRRANYRKIRTPAHRLRSELDEAAQILQFAQLIVSQCGIDPAPEELIVFDGSKSRRAF